ncbi:MAG: hypothetical protein IPJ19_01170 [Planctomycetes bacterium]|nr:hypothetical protein [Planctomycetota bacterium]
MSALTLLCGTPGSSLLLLARELDGAPFARVLFPWNLGGALEELARATRERAQAWRGPLAEGVPWIERSLELAAPALVEALLERERVQRGAIEWFGIGHFALARHAVRLARVLPQARFVLCGDDGRVAPSGRIPEQATQRERALAGFEWGEQWSASVGPLLSIAEELGPRLVVLREEELVSDPEAVEAALLGREERSAWRTTRPWKRERLEGDALAGFACSRAARLWQRALGHELPEPGADVLAEPELACARALVALEDGDPARGEDLLARARPDELALSQPAAARFEFTRGRIALAQGDRARALRSWLRAIDVDPVQPESWEQAFELREAPELERLAGRARRSEVPRVRHALARWLVARGLDAEAAELVAGVEHQPWAQSGR